MKKTVLLAVFLYILVFIITPSASGSDLFFEIPVKSGTVSCDYNWTNCASPGNYHTGIDFADQSSIYPTNQGRVVTIQLNDVGCNPDVIGGCDDHGMGNTIIIEHILEDGNNVYSLYAHLDSITSGLEIGDWVTKESIIGIMGRTGYGLANYWSVHLHFEIKDDNLLHNPSGSGLHWGYVPQSASNYGYYNPNDYFGIVKVKEQTRFMDFEDGVDGDVISSKIPGMTFTTTEGYDWIYGDWRTGEYNGPFPNGVYTSNGNFFAWLGPAQGTGRIDFTGSTATHLSLLTSTATGLIIDAYDINDDLITSSEWAENNISTGEMAKLSVSALDMAYVLIHDAGNFWLIDDLEVKDLLSETIAKLPADIIAEYENLDTINQGQSKLKQFFNHIVQNLKIILGWGGSEFSIHVYKPDGSFYNDYQSDTPPIEVDIPNADIGEWQFEITAVDVPTDDYPFALVVGIPDSDGDNIADQNDNCPNNYNPDQGDSNENGIGDICEVVQGDLDGDGDVDLDDINIVVGCFGQTVADNPGCEMADVIEDGVIDILDVSFVGSNFTGP